MSTISAKIRCLFLCINVAAKCTVTTRTALLSAVAQNLRNIGLFGILASSLCIVRTPLHIERPSPPKRQPRLEKFFAIRPGTLMTILKSGFGREAEHTQTRLLRSAITFACPWSHESHHSVEIGCFFLFMLTLCASVVNACNIPDFPLTA